MAEEIQAGVTDIFSALAIGWLSEAHPQPGTAEVAARLEKADDPTARGFLLALRGDYEEALTYWETRDEEQSGRIYVAGASYLASRLLSVTASTDEEIPALADGDLDKAMQCIGALREFQGLGEEEIAQLAERLKSACQ
jgi:hypothetical protein